MLQRAVVERLESDRRNRDERLRAARARFGDERIGGIAERRNVRAVLAVGNVLVEIIAGGVVDVVLPVVARRRVAAPAAHGVADLRVARRIAVGDAEDQRTERMHVRGRVDGDGDRRRAGGGREQTGDDNAMTMRMTISRTTSQLTDVRETDFRPRGTRRLRRRRAVLVATGGRRTKEEVLKALPALGSHRESDSRGEAVVFSWINFVKRIS